MKSNKKRKCDNDQVKLRGVISESLNKGIVYKSATKGQTSFRITAKLLATLTDKVESLSMMPRLIISIPDNKGIVYTLNCSIKKEKEL